MPSVYLAAGRAAALRRLARLLRALRRHPARGRPGRAAATAPARSSTRRDVADGAELPALRSPPSRPRAACRSRSAPRVVGVLSVESADADRRRAAPSEAERAADAARRAASPSSARSTPPRPASGSPAPPRAPPPWRTPTPSIREAAAAALEVSGMESVLVALRDARRPRPRPARRRPARRRLHRRSPRGELAAMAALGRARHDDGERWPTPPARGDAVAEPLRQAGAGALLVVPLAVGRARLGFLALADRSTLPPDTERTELIELLGVQTAAQLRGLAAVVELRDRAARDPLTGLGHQRAFQRRLPRAPQGRRRGRPEGRRARRLTPSSTTPATPRATRSCAAWPALLAERRRRTAPTRLPARRRRVRAADGHRRPRRGPGGRLAAAGQARERLGVTLSIGVAVADGDETDARAARARRRRGRRGRAARPRRRRARRPTRRRA